jgi:hypothetical protein
MHLVPLGKGRTYLVVADTGIDDDPLILRLDQEGMDTDLILPVSSEKAG